MIVDKAWLLTRLLHTYYAEMERKSKRTEQICRQKRLLDQQGG